MYCSFGLQTGRRSLKIAVLDTIHGASTIARKMVELGIEAEALEVYHHAPKIERFDLVVVPVHLWPGNIAFAEARRLKKKIITHHQAIGELLMSDLSDSLEIFEITGTHSKTTTALLLAKLLSIKKRVVSHTTRGLEIWQGGTSSVFQMGLSITAGNVINALQAAQAQGADALVSEISLGGTGLADIGILSSFSGDYRIAQNTKWASTAKLQMVSLAKEGAKLVTNTDTRLSSDVSFGNGGYVQAEPGRINFGRDEMALELSEDLDFPAYRTAISAAVSATLAAGVTFSEISSAFEGFNGFSGRMKIIRNEGITIFDSSNSGLKVRDVSLALDRASGGRLGLIAGEESETVCEGMNIPDLVDLLRKRRDEMDLLVLVGRRLVPWAGELRAKTARDLAAGLELAQAQSSGLDRLLLCVKCFR